MNIYYDSANHRLVFVKDKADSRFWESHWDTYKIHQIIRPAVFSRSVLSPTGKYLPKGSRILEGGCGQAQYVWALHSKGYEAYGVDYARETVERIKNMIPEIKISYGDVRDLDFSDNFFDGYWSLGVIEHFYDGFEDIASEMKRVIRPGGYLFLTFPCISGFREKKIKEGKYDIWQESPELTSNFYQFALSSENVESEFIKNGFELVAKKKNAGFKGMKDEIEPGRLKQTMQNMFNSKNYLIKGLKWGFDQVLSPYFGHMQLLILKNSK
ncbi:MAG: class I SAM-dependent methyltransferase [Proteobacteria bacterium]|nr:class I SAM-dependent methyltransferase [Pseudomonadota bacterium]MBU1389505.1 class I SAM-dependent methyltransferase [Pseudomonadota bacterium]MBU1541325.1 class I SAM-dependent methyltransferase [Pseudomonadota bacterium]MBU2431077.1 class I SAM-dependent methyltransferase [Pseudomonadota bacterium]MBU2480562.1 class I SAM-dependent methyltransferase [Pseudomonadota bacterium]